MARSEGERFLITHCVPVTMTEIFSVSIWAFVFKISTSAKSAIFVTV